MKRKTKLISLMLAIVLLVPALTACGAPGGPADALSEDIVILYTNDTHTYIEGPLSFDTVAALRQQLEQQYAHVLLVDAGDHVQGTAYGSMDEGATVIALMNAAGYDAAAPGNHEFDYGIQRFMQNIDAAQFPYLSCNFHTLENGVRGENVLESFVTFPCGEEVVAFVGITTPEAFEPAYFRDEAGGFLYGFGGGADGAALYADVQAAIDAAQAVGATKIIALGHVGNAYVTHNWASSDIIANTDGLDAFIDGHSHATLPGETVADRDGDAVVLTQTGEYFSHIGMMVIDSETDAITTELIGSSEIPGKDGQTVMGYALESERYDGAEIPSDPAVGSIRDAWMAEIDELLGKPIGSTELELDNYDGDTRLVRRQETNTGDFAADALYYLFDSLEMEVDVAVTNGGGVRNRALTGALTYKSCKDIHTFGNVACLQTVTGRQLLDALEWGSRGVGTEEIGSFLQVSGLTYCVDTSVASTVQGDENGVWIGGPTGGYRVCDVQVYNRDTDCYEPLDLNAHYNLAGYNYTLRDLGGGFAMFDEAANVIDYVMEDYMVLANYILGFEHGVVEAKNSPLLEKYPNLLLDYANVNGSGRIIIR